MITFPMQCSCGHIYLERYQYKKPTDEGVVGFCWCGFCRTRFDVKEKPYLKAITEGPSGYYFLDDTTITSEDNRRLAGLKEG